MKKTVCNKCGKPFNMWDEQEDFSIYRRAGYGTRYDGSWIRLDLCCDCMEDLIESCKISPVADTQEEDDGKTSCDVARFQIPMEWEGPTW